MKLDRLTSTTQHLSHEAADRARHVAGESIARVSATEGVEGDRQRSLQQELAEFNQKAVGPFEGGEQVLAAAHEIAQQISSLGSKRHTLVKTPTNDPLHHGVDAKA